MYWPLFVLIFYFICPIPHFIATRVGDDSDAASSACRELAYFFTTGIVVSAFGFPIILARVEAVSPRWFLILRHHFLGVIFNPAFISLFVLSPGENNPLKFKKNSHD